MINKKLIEKLDKIFTIDESFSTGCIAGSDTGAGFGARVGPGMNVGKYVGGMQGRGADYGDSGVVGGSDTEFHYVCIYNDEDIENNNFTPAEVIEVPDAPLHDGGRDRHAINLGLKLVKEEGKNVIVFSSKPWEDEGEKYCGMVAYGGAFTPDKARDFSNGMSRSYHELGKQRGHHNGKFVWIEVDEYEGEEAFPDCETGYEDREWMTNLQRKQ